MKRFISRQPKPGQPESPAGTQPGSAEPPAISTANDGDRRRFSRTLLLGVPLAAAALAATAEPQTAQAAAAGDTWKMEGNNNVDDNDFLGTTTNKPLVIKTNNSERMRVLADGRVGIGTASPAAKLQVSSSILSTLRAETTAKNGIGVLGIAASRDGAFGVEGAHLGGGIGVLGSSDTSIGSGQVRGVGVKGTATGNSVSGMSGEATGDFSAGVRASSAGINSNAVEAFAEGENSAGVHAEGAGTGVFGLTNATDGFGVFAFARASTGSGIGLISKAASPTASAAQFFGKVQVNGTLSKSAGAFKIDHPLDPANKYLYHSFVESPDMLNVYNGNVTLDANGEAAVELPAWCEALCRDWRYQLTAIGAPGPKLHIAKKIKNNRFRIAGGQAGQEVSWQVTGIRQDAYANANRIPVEQDKPADERGTFLHPLEHGQPEQRGLHFERIQQRVAALDAEKATS